MCLVNKHISQNNGLLWLMEPNNLTPGLQSITVIVFVHMIDMDTNHKGNAALFPPVSDVTFVSLCCSH